MKLPKYEENIFVERQHNHPFESLYYTTYTFQWIGKDGKSCFQLQKGWRIKDPVYYKWKFITEVRQAGRLAIASEIRKNRSVWSLCQEIDVFGYQVNKLLAFVSLVSLLLFASALWSVQQARYQIHLLKEENKCLGELIGHEYKPITIRRSNGQCWIVEPEE